MYIYTCIYIYVYIYVYTYYTCVYIYINTCRKKKVLCMYCYRIKTLYSGLSLVYVGFRAVDASRTAHVGGVQVWSLDMRWGTEFVWGCLGLRLQPSDCCSRYLKGQGT